MRMVATGIALLIFSGCPNAENEKHLSLMNHVEGSVKLPRGARPLNHYQRFYSYGAGGAVLAEFVGGPDERRWVKSYKDFPSINDGGCGVVNVRFSVRTGHSDVWCNGVA